MATTAQDSKNLIEKNKFLYEEYKTLREEIKETKQRIFHLAVTGITGIPTAYFLVSASKEKILVLSLPFLIITLLLLFLSESRALMRCGKYIRLRIEPEFIKENESISGWEHWLEGEDAETRKSIMELVKDQSKNRKEIEKIDREIKGRRSVNRILSFLFYMIFVIYYLAAAYLSAVEFQRFMTNFNIADLLHIDLCFYFVFSLFLIAGVLFLIYLVRTKDTSNTTLYE